ncbi:hypothetical protein PPL_03481 [Heterostelium album PN500]|uniref:Uncharacterized protein n=1 Tax=Heterostelium pallidum (strain ATCC 26659 / Pp 5 / PN500) TaxID=670386 RepID=D3B505_HETP5|nr:hypothetical protein PPL_03481 [Heterostelium album PN500]EFA84403.1 hypothetical protein PPL_03481 [Heterostelium album PN500]|eukprot:XP_020436517.1 hypothetical protein PPL_03481 [Heterostelium album PN500]
MGGNDVHHSTSTSPNNNNDDNDHVKSNNQTALTLPDVTKSSLLNESVDNNPPSCRASINSSLETLDVISDQSSVVDEDDKLHVLFYQERFDMETPPSSLHQQIQQQLQQQQHQHQQVVPDLQLETTTSTNDKEIMVENVADALLLQQLEDSLESPIIIPETKPVERASVSIPSLELNNSNNNINNKQLLYK